MRRRRARFLREKVNRFSISVFPAAGRRIRPSFSLPSPSSLRPCPDRPAGSGALTRARHNIFRRGMASARTLAAGLMLGPGTSIGGVGNCKGARGPDRDLPPRLSLQSSRGRTVRRRSCIRAMHACVGRSKILRSLGATRVMRMSRTRLVTPARAPPLYVASSPACVH